MNRHSLTYVDLHPQPIERASEAPHPLALLAGAAGAAGALWLVLSVLFSL